MPRRRNAAPLAVAVPVALFLGLCLAGCVQQTPHVIPTAEPNTKPVFASDAAALAAAKKAFTGYVAASNAIGNDGGAKPDRIAPWVTSNRLKTELTAFTKFSATRDRLTGGATFSTFKLQELDQSDGQVTLTAYVCDEVAGSRLVDSGGNDITPPSRQDTIPLEVRFENEKRSSHTLLIDGSDPWTGSNFCS